MATIETLSHRHRQVLELIAEGRSDREIAERLGIAAQTVRHHCQAIYAALGVADKGNPRVAAAVRWVAQGRRLLVP